MTMDARMELAGFSALAPAAREALSAVSTELVKIRASQINGWAFFVPFHLNDARRAKGLSDEVGSGCGVERGWSLQRKRDGCSRG